MGDLLSKILGFIDRPWKVGAVILLFIVGGTGYLIYDKRDVLFEEWLTPSEIILDMSAVPAALDKLVEESEVDLIQIWAVDLSANSQRFIAGRRKDGQRPFIPEPRRFPIITRVTDVEALEAIISGRPACVTISLNSLSPVVHRLAERGMVFGCGVPIPPSHETFVGIIYMSWLTAPSLTVQSTATGAAREIAAKLVNR